jgi:ATP-dependent protease ClpP protease subunit
MFIKNDTATILINGEVTPQMGEELSYFLYGVQFMDEIKNIEVNICSGGGSVLAGYAIYTALLNAREAGKNVITNCNGIAASISGIIFLAGNVRNIRDYGLVMIHNPSGGDDKTLNKIKQSLKKILTKNFKGNLDELMDEETWYNADELKTFGLVDNIIETDLQLTGVNLDTKEENIKNLYEICNSFLTKNNKEVMKLKDYFKAKEDEKLKLITNADEEKIDEPSKEETVEETENEGEELEIPEEETVEEEDAMSALDARVSALEEMIKQIATANESLITENNALKNTKEEEEKIEVLNKVGVDKKDFKKWLSYDLPTIKNLTSTLKQVKTSPIVAVTNDRVLTQEVFNAMSKDEKEIIFKNDKNSYWKFFKNTK